MSQKEGVSRNMIEMALGPSKKTPNKLRWAYWVEEDKVYFEFYIPKWRVPGVPETWPGRIFVGIEPFIGDPSDFTQSPCDNLDNSIEVLIKPIEGEYHAKTVHYRQLGDRDDWQIGEPYIPFSLIPPDSHSLIIEVKWDLDSKGQFVGVPTYREDM